MACEEEINGKEKTLEEVRKIFVADFAFAVAANWDELGNLTATVTTIGYHVR